MAEKTIIVTNRSFVFTASKLLGLFPTRAKPPKKIRTAASLLTTMMILLVILQLNYLIFPPARNTYPYGAFMSMVWRVYAIVSLLMMTAIFITHFRQISRTEYFEFVVEESNSKIGFNITSVVFTTITSYKTAVFASKTFQNYYYAKNFKSAAIYASYTAQSASEIILYLIVSQMCAMLNVIITLLDNSRSDQGSVISKMSRLHDALDLSVAVNQLYKRQILYMVVYFVIFLINRSYHAMMLLFNRNTFDMTLFGFNLVTICGLCIPLVLPLGPCEKLKKTVDAYYDELYNEIKQSEFLRKNNKLRLYMNLRRNANFSACGFFSLGYSLITSIMASVTTYAVILVQFSIKEPRVDNSTKPFYSKPDILED